MLILANTRGATLEFRFFFCMAAIRLNWMRGYSPCPNKLLCIRFLIAENFTLQLLLRRDSRLHGRQLSFSVL